MQDIGVNLERVRENINRSAEVSGRKPEEIKLVAVSKNVDIVQVETAMEHGITDAGENRVQEFLRKYASLADRLSWHFIGHLQKNKVKYIIDKVDLIHSLDRLSLAKEIQKRASKSGREVDVLVQVNVSGEESKYGLDKNQTIDFVAEVAKNYPLIHIRGLMTMAPFTDDPEETRPVFRELRELSESISERLPGIDMDYLSMGMSNDYTVAIEEGANMIRVGTSIFGERQN